MKTARYYFKLVALPLFFFILFSSLFLLWKIFELPTGEHLVRLVKYYFDLYGLLIVFLSAVIEGVLLVGNYFPGAFIIFLSIIMTESVYQATIFIALIISALFIAHILNYLLGRYGWYRLLVRLGLKEAVNKSREQLIKKGTTAIFLTYWLPNLGALTDTAAGIIHMPFKKFFFYSFLATTVWGIFFGTVAFFLRDFILLFLTEGGNEFLSKVFVLFVIFLWMIALIYGDFLKNQKLRKKEYL